MARQAAQLVLDDDAYVELTVNIPLPLYRDLHAYCVFRNAASERLQAVARGAMRTYLADNEAFQAWLREHPDLPPRCPNRRFRAAGVPPGGAPTAPTPLPPDSETRRMAPNPAGDGDHGQARRAACRRDRGT